MTCATKFLCLAGLIGLLAAPEMRADDAKPGENTVEERHALLVGCTKYPFVDRLHELYGPANDVSLWRQFLTEHGAAGFSFPPSNVRQLLGWPKEVDQRPTRANIAKAFESLVEKSRPHVQIAIVLSGHGTQQPIPDEQDPFDPKNPEPDGLDEVFLPADSKEGSPAIENGILDDEIGRWLDRMKAKGADVWIVFDCCHSGTMTRGAASDERDRGVEPTDLGVSKESLQRAADKVRLANTRTARAPGEENPPLEPIGKAATGGSLVAFYAAQAFEKAPELPRPADAARTPDNYYGLLSYTLVQTLRQQNPRQPLTYRALTQALLGRYRAERGSRSPTPLFSGDIDREVLGVKQWPKQTELLLQRADDGLRIDGGELAGATVDSILAVFPPAGDARDGRIALGHVRVTKSGAATAQVNPCAFAGAAAVDPAGLPHLARCRIVSQSVGDMRLKLHLDKPTDSELLARYDLELAAFKLLPKEVSQTIELVADAAKAQWELRVVSPAMAKKDFGRQIDDPQVWLFNVEGSRVARAGGSPKVFARYVASKADKLAGQLDLDLQRVGTWQNVWRVAGTTAGSPQGDVRLEVATPKDEQDAKGEAAPATSLRPGQRFEVRLRNAGGDDVWATLLFLDADFGIEVWHSGAIAAGASPRPIRGTINDKAFGPEGFVALVVPVSQQKVEPDYHFLEQQPLGLASRGARDAAPPPTTPFGQLMSTAAFGKGTRSANREAPDNPDILSWTWVTLPAAESPQ